MRTKRNGSRTLDMSYRSLSRFVRFRTRIEQIEFPDHTRSSRVGSIDGAVHTTGVRAQPARLLHDVHTATATISSRHFAVSELSASNCYSVVVRVYTRAEFR